MANTPYKIYLEEEEMPKYWYNMKAVMKELPIPFIHPGTLKPCTAEDLAPVFCSDLVAQELNTTDKYIEIPESLLGFYRMYRPSPLSGLIAWKSFWTPRLKSTTSLKGPIPRAPTS